MWKQPQKRARRKSDLFLSQNRNNPSSVDEEDVQPDEKTNKLDPNLISDFMTEELDYQRTLADLSVNIKIKQPKPKKTKETCRLF